MRNNLIIFILSTVLALSCIAQAQPKPPSGGMILKHLTRELDLTVEQAAKVKAIFKSTQDKMEGLRKQMDEQREQMMDAADSIKTSEEAQIEKLLNDDQKKKFNEMKEEREKHPPMRGERDMPHDGDGPRPDRGPDFDK